MGDIAVTSTRSKIMSSIKGKNTKIEMQVRKRLWKRGFRYRIHKRDLAGKPDMVFPKYKSIIFVHGCFWHGHNCHLFRLPKTRTGFWKTKIDRNRKNDTRCKHLLEKSGWRVLPVWECMLRGKRQEEVERVFEQIEAWLVKGRK